VRARTGQVQVLEQASYAILPDGAMWAWFARRDLGDWPRLNLAVMVIPLAGYLAGLVFPLAGAVRRRLSPAAVL